MIDPKIKEAWQWANGIIPTPTPSHIAVLRDSYVEEAWQRRKAEFSRDHAGCGRSEFRNFLTGIPCVTWSCDSNDLHNRSDDQWRESVLKELREL